MNLMTKIGCIALDVSKRVCVTRSFQDVICDACDSCPDVPFFYSQKPAFTTSLKLKKLKTK